MSFNNHIESSDATKKRVFEKNLLSGRPWSGSNFRAQQKKIAVRPEKFAVTLKKFPVPRRREFRCKRLKLLLVSR
jgi:hypothetical protein